MQPYMPQGGMHYFVSTLTLSSRPMTQLDDHRKIEALHENWVALEREGRFTALPSMLAPGVIVQPEGGAPVIGRGNVAAAFFSEDGAGLKVESNIVELKPYENTAVKIASFKTTMPDGSVSEGFHTWFLARTSNWRISYLSWTFIGEGS